MWEQHANIHYVGSPISAIDGSTKECGIKTRKGILCFKLKLQDKCELSKAGGKKTLN